MNDSRPPPLSEPDFDPHREGKRGLLFGVVAALVLLGIIYFLSP